MIPCEYILETILISSTFDSVITKKLNDLLFGPSYIIYRMVQKVSH